MKLAPIDLWRSNEGARREFNESINSVLSRSAIAFALAQYQAEVCHLEEGAAMLKGANGIIDKLLNIGEGKAIRKNIDFNLPNPEEFTINQPQHV